MAMRRVCEELEAAGPDASRSAHFVCSLCVCWPDGRAEIFDGRVEGTLVWPPRGELGFGYDPMFVPAGYEQTFGEMDPAEKHRISHRAAAFRKLVASLL
jgi:XTP/dITP diphosphohydrolase